MVDTSPLCAAHYNPAACYCIQYHVRARQEQRPALDHCIHYQGTATALSQRCLDHIACKVVPKTVPSDKLLRNLYVHLGPADQTGRTTLGVALLNLQSSPYQVVEGCMITMHIQPTPPYLRPILLHIVSC